MIMIKKLKINRPVKARISVLYSKLDKALGEGDLEAKKFRKAKKAMRRNFKLSTKTKYQKILKIVLMASITTGIGVLISYHQPSRQLVIAVGSKFRKFFTSSDQNLDSNTALETSNKSNPKIGKWVVITGAIFLAAIKVSKILNNEESIEVEIIPVPFWSFKTFRKYQPIIGTGTAVSGLTTLIMSDIYSLGYKLGYGLFFLGWQIATQGVSS